MVEKKKKKKTSISTQNIVKAYMKILSFGNKNQIHFCHYSGTIHKLYMQGQLNENLKLIYVCTYECIGVLLWLIFTFKHLEK